jgi:Tfp pilus assembly protein PilF
VQCQGAVDRSSLVLRAEAEKGRKHPEKEEAFLRRAIENSHQQSPATYWALYQCLLAQHKDKEASLWLRRHLELTNEINELRPAITRDAAKLAGDPDRCVKVARTLLKIGHDRGALNYLSMALRANPKQVDAHLLLADYFERQNQPEQAERHRQEAKSAAHAPAPPKKK